MKQLRTWKLILKSVQKNVPVMLLYVLESSGSSPGRQGFFMAVNANAEMEGSLGGGIMEHKFVELAKAKLNEDESETSVHKQIHDKAAPKNQSGMICSGEQTIFLYRVQPADHFYIERIIESLDEHQNGSLHLSPAGIRFENKVPSEDFRFSMQSEEEWSYAEKTGYKNHLYIIGGGHCALALSEIMRRMDFYIELFEDRPDLNTMNRNNHVHKKHVIKDYSLLSELVREGENNYVVVMTFGYRSDDVAVRALINKRFKYFGLLGSRKKIEKMFADYLREGISEDILKKIHAPVGLNIKSQTPEEIAVSIAAEIISVKNSQ